MSSEDSLSEGTELERGLPMVSKWDPEALERDKQELAELSGKPICVRVRAYFGRMGPGFLQSAVTLGGGSAMSSLMAGAHAGYALLWVQPLAMFFGIIMLSAMAYQTLSTGMRPFHAMRRYVHPGMAWAWALASLAATIIWHFPQYSLAGAMGSDLIAQILGEGEAEAGGARLRMVAVGLVVLVISTAVTWSYGSGRRGMKLYERTIKYMVWSIVIALLLVVILLAREGRIDWARLFSGFLPTYIPTDSKGVEIMIGAFAAAVGINMTFLFPYTLLARGWGREHREVAGFDLLIGMWLPYTIATGLMLVVAAVMLDGPPKSALEASAVLGPIPGGRVIFDLGVFGMALSTIPVHMLMSAFILCEIMGWEPSGWRYRLAALIPAPGILGTLFWKEMAIWLPVPTSAVCGLLLPIAYTGFLLLHNNARYMTDAMPKGRARVGWNLGIGIAVALSGANAVYYLIAKVPPFVQGLLGS